MSATLEHPPAETSSPAAPSASTPPAILADALVKVYGERRVVDGVSFELRKGEILGLLGPNGAGKTTTMRMLTGYTPPTSGRAAIDGYDLERESLRARARLGYLPENAPLYSALAVCEYLQFMCELKGRPRAERDFEVNRVIESCDLGDVARRRIDRISRGYRQRVGLAQALLGDPSALILDEPTVGLDPKQIVEIRRLIRRAAEGRAVIISTHILPEVSAICDRVLIIARGRPVAVGSPERLKMIGVDGERRGASARIRVVVQGDAGPAREIIEKVAGVERVKAEEPRRAQGDRETAFIVSVGPGADPRREIARALVERNLGLIEIASLGASLEEIFIQAISAANTAGTS